MAKKINLGIKNIKSSKIKFLDFTDDIADSLGSKLPLITLFGNTRTIIDGCFGIIEYEDNIIKISVKNGFISFLGKDLKISNFSDALLSFEGSINSVEFSV
jgi:sporulation protein YqfC